MVLPTPRSSSITARVETVTPAIAKRWLDTLPQEGNRKAMKTHVDFIAHQIATGRWGLNGQGLILTAAEGLLDGQHRCMAIVKAARPVETLVVRGVDPKEFGTIDTGVTRNANHVLQIRGRPNCTNLAAALRLLANHRDGTFGGSSARVTNTRVLDLDEANPGMSDSVAWAMRAYHTMRMSHVWKVPAAAYAHFFTMETDDDKATRFYEVLLEDEPAAASRWPATSALALRERLAQAWKRRERLVLQEVLGSFILAWNVRSPSVTWKELVWRRQPPGAKAEAFPKFRSAS